jgi:hypothetical protein
MASVKEIITLCKEGKTDEAYQTARTDYDANRDNEWCQHEIAWALYYLIKSDSERGDYAALDKHLEEIMTCDILDVNADNLIIGNLFFKIGHFIRNYMPLNLPDSMIKLSSIFSRVKTCQFNPSNGYSYFLSAVIKFDKWSEMGDFIDWWNLDNFMPEDYEKIQLKNSGHSIMSLAERAYSRYYKSLSAQIRLGHVSAEKVDEFIKRLDRLNESHPEYAFTLYHKSLLLLSLNRKEDALNSIRPFVKKKHNDFWVWDVLAETTDDREIQLSCYCRALSCKVDQKFVVRVRTKLCQLLVEENELSAAKCEIDKVVETYVKEQWRLPSNIEEITRQSWYASTEASPSNWQFYQAHLFDSESFLFLDTPEIAIFITRYNREKNICNFVTTDHKRGFFNTTKMKCRFFENQILKVRLASPIAAGKITTIVTYKPEKDISGYEDVFVKKFSGTISMKDGKSFGFVDSVFVDGRLLQDITDGAAVTGTAVISYNVKKDRWGWRATKIKQ